MIGNDVNRDKELFSLISEGNEAAFEELFLLYVPPLEEVVGQIVKRKEVVKDIIQEVFLHLWLDRYKLQEVEEPRKWIFKIMYNRCYRWVNRQILEQKVQYLMQSQQSAFSSTNNTEETIGFLETTRLVKQAIQQLSPQSKKIYLLSREEGLKLTEIATRLNISLQSVKNSLHRSSIIIRNYLADHHIYVPLILLMWNGV